MTRNRPEIMFALALILMGGLFLLANLLDIRAWALFWPLLLIVLGVWLIARPRISPTRYANLVFFGDLSLAGSDLQSNKQIVLFVGDVGIDLTTAELPPGETTIRINGFVYDVDVRAPDEVGVSLAANAFVVHAKFLGHKHEGFLSPARFSSDAYERAERRVRLELNGFVMDVDVWQI